MKPRGFTLIELSVVILIVGIAAAAVTLKVQRPLQFARLGDAVGALVDFDQTTRSAARGQDRPLRMMMNVSSGTVRRLGETGQTPGGSTLGLSSPVRLARVLVRQQDCRDGEIAIMCSRKGLTPTYAVLLESGSRRQWVVFVGLSGQVVQVDSENEARDILAAASLGRDAR